MKTLAEALVALFLIGTLGASIIGFVVYLVMVIF
jgi:hypothetical protein